MVHSKEFNQITVFVDGLYIMSILYERIAMITNWLKLSGFFIRQMEFWLLKRRGEAGGWKSPRTLWWLQNCEFSRYHSEVVEMMNLMFCVFSHNKKRGYFIPSPLQRTPLFSITVSLFLSLFSSMFIFLFFFFLAVVSGLRWTAPNLNPNCKTQLSGSSQRNRKHGNLPEDWERFSFSLFVEIRLLTLTLLYTVLPLGWQTKAGDKPPPQQTGLPSGSLDDT